MTSPSAIAVIIGIVGALIGVYFRESLRRAYRQKLIATKLEAQINTLFFELVRSDFIKILAIASVWSNERTTALQAQGSEGFIEVERKYNAKLQEMKKTIDAGDADTDKTIEKLHAAYKEMPQSIFDYHKAHYDLARDQLFSGLGLLTDEEAAELSWDTAARISALRNHATKLIHHFLTLTLALREMTTLDLHATRPLFSSLIEDMIYFSLEIEPLRTKAKLLRETSVISLAAQSMVRGS